MSDNKYEDAARDPVTLFLQGRYVDALDSLIPLIKADVEFLPDPKNPERKWRVKDLLKQVLDAYVKTLHTCAQHTLQTWQDRVESEPKAALEALEACIQKLDDPRLPPWRRPQEARARLQELAQQARQALRRRQQSQKLQEQARQAPSRAEQWRLLYEAWRFAPTPELVDTWATVQQNLLFDLEQRSNQIRRLFESERYRSVLRLTADLPEYLLQIDLASLPVELQEKAQAIQDLLQQMLALRKQAQEARREQQRFRHLLRLLEQHYAADDLAAVEQLLNQVPERFRHDPRVDVYRFYLKRYNELAELLNLSSVDDLAPIVELRQRAIKEPPQWANLFNAIADIWYAEHREQQGGFLDAFDSYLRALARLASASPSLKEKVRAPWEARAWQGLRRFWAYEEPERWHQLWQRWQRRVQGKRARVQHSPNAALREDLQQLREQLEAILRIAPQAERSRWAELIRQVEDALTQLDESEVVERWQHIAHNLAQLDEALAQGDLVRGKTLLAELRAALAQLQPQALTLPVEQAYTQRWAQWHEQVKKSLEEAEHTFFEVFLPALYQRDLQRLEAAWQNLHTQVQPLSSLLDSEAEAEPSIEPGLRARQTFLVQLVHALDGHKLQALLNGQQDKDETGSLLSTLHSLSSNPYASKLIEILDEPRGESGLA